VGETEDAKKMGFLAAIREKSQSWVVLSCDAHLVSAVRVGYGSRASGPLANQISCEHFLNIRHFARETHNCSTEYSLFLRGYIKGVEWLCI